MNLNIRKEKESDVAQVYQVNKTAFIQVEKSKGLEADIVENLRKADCDIISLVAEVDNKAVGHIMFSPVYINEEVAGMLLAPLAVLPEFQKQGIGSALIKAGIDEVKNRDYSLIILFGHPEYYPRFGFVPASKYGLKSAFECPDEVFMAKAGRKPEFTYIIINIINLNFNRGLFWINTTIV